jgi:peptidoglycan/LPS O-acetylase OafA/YrhL
MVKDTRDYSFENACLFILAKIKLAYLKYRADIDGLRAIAVLTVIGFHSFPGIVKGGFVGVDVFFVISGFLISNIICSNLENNSFSYLDFYARRIRRIFPALILVLLSCFVFGWFELPPTEYKQLGKHIASGTAFVSNFTLWTESGYFDDFADTKPLVHLWSLGIEEQFYVVWPLLMGLAWKRRWNILVLTLVIGVVSFAMNIFTITTDPIAAFYSPLCRFWELMVGSTLAYITHHKPQCLLQSPNWQSSLGFVLIAASVLTLHKSSMFPGWWALLPTFGAFLLISAGPEAWLNKYFLANPYLVRVGLISFPLYLWHWPALYFVNNYRLVSPNGSSKLYWAIKVAAILVCFLLSYLTYRYFERVVRFTKGPATVWFLVLSLAALGSVSVSLAFSNGFDWRYPQQIREVLNFRFNSNEAYRHGTCFLEISDNKSKFFDCTSSSMGDGQSLVLWGDSHAAHLYPGLKSIVGTYTEITQLNTGSCPPILGHTVARSPNCKLNNEFVAENIRVKKPRMVILSAGWGRYDYWRELTETIEFIKKSEIKEIVLVGPAPRWNGSLPRQLFESYRLNKASTIPARLTVGLDNRIFPLDIEMEIFARRLGVKYISLYKILCNEQGCLTRAGSAADSLTAFDYDHLTTIGSIYVVNHFPAWFFKTLERGPAPILP